MRETRGGFWKFHSFFHLIESLKNGKYFFSASHLCLEVFAHLELLNLSSLLNSLESILESVFITRNKFFSAILYICFSGHGLQVTPFSSFVKSPKFTFSSFLAFFLARSCIVLLAALAIYVVTQVDSCNIIANLNCR